MCACVYMKFYCGHSIEVNWNQISYIVPFFLSSFVIIYIYSTFDRIDKSKSMNSYHVFWSISRIFDSFFYSFYISIRFDSMILFPFVFPFGVCWFVWRFWPFWATYWMNSKKKKKQTTKWKHLDQRNLWEWWMCDGFDSHSECDMFSIKYFIRYICLTIIYYMVICEREDNNLFFDFFSLLLHLFGLRLMLWYG